MKKILFAITLVIVAMFGINTNVLAAENEAIHQLPQSYTANPIDLLNNSTADVVTTTIENPVFYDETLDLPSSKTYYLEPNYQDIVTSQSVVVSSSDSSSIGIMPMGTWSANRDNYEDNNSFDIASDMSIGAPNDLYSGSIAFNANIHKEPWYLGGAVDQDYYRVDVFADAQLRLELYNVPTGKDYDLELFMFPDVKEPEWEDVTRIAQAKIGGDGQGELIIKNVTPGTYFVRVYPYQSDDWDETNFYRLYIGQTLQARSNVSIQSLKNAGAKAAIWQSDIEPFGLNSFGIENKVFVGSTLVTQYNFINQYANPFHEKLAEYAVDSKVVDTVVYIWDIQMRIQLYQILWDMAEILEDEVAANQEIVLTFEYITGGIKILGTVIGAIPTPQTKILGVVLTGSTTGAGFIVPALFPATWGDKKESLLNYLYVLMAALEADQNTSPSEIVHIKLRYQYQHEYTITGVWNYYIDLVTENTLEGFLYSGTSIGVTQSGSYSRGQVYAIRNLTDFISFKNGTLSPGIPSTGGGGGGGGGPITIEPMNFPNPLETNE